MAVGRAAIGIVAPHMPAAFREQGLPTCAEFMLRDARGIIEQADIRLAQASIELGRETVERHVPDEITGGYPAIHFLRNGVPPRAPPAGDDCCSLGGWQSAGVLREQAWVTQRAIDVDKKARGRDGEDRIGERWRQ